jgi:hypothetical protein
MTLSTKALSALPKLIRAAASRVRSILRKTVRKFRNSPDDPDQGFEFAGVAVPVKPRPPVLVGKAAKEFPILNEHQDLAA